MGAYLCQYLELIQVTRESAIDLLTICADMDT